MAIRLIATDMDDTLLGADGRLSARTTEAVRAVVRRGVVFVLASGRMPQAMREAARELDLCGPMIAYNGALTLDLGTDTVLESLPVPQDLAREAARLAEELGGHVQAYQNGEYLFAKDNAHSQAYAASIGLRGRETGLPLSQCLVGGANKLLVIGEREEIRRWAPQMRAHFGRRLCCAISRPNYIEVFRAGVDKAAALEALCRRLGIARQETAAFGDGENDLGMVHFAGRGYIMANAREDVLCRAPLRAPSNAQDGLAQILEQMLADGEIPENV